MRSLTLAYRDADRLPVIFAIRKTAERRYDVDVRVVQIQNEEDFEAALFDGSADALIEHLEFLYQEATKGKRITMFSAPSKGGGLYLVVARQVGAVEEFKGRTMAVRAQGQPFAVTLWLRMLGLDKDVKTIIIDDKDIGRWAQWKKVASGECIATFMSPLYLPEALSAGLKVLPVPEIPIVGHFAQACLAEFARINPELMRSYVKAVLDALAWLIKRPAEAYAALEPELKPQMKVPDDTELRRRFDAVVNGIKLRPYPTLEAIANTYEIATLEYPGAKGINPLTLWDLHWVKELDDAGFIDALTA
jgi:ABC-type nitrate/sulfonate/bicarbonate transport system substrate-binding protein